METTALQVTGDGYSVAIIPTATEDRNKLLAATGKIADIADPDRLSYAQRAMKALADLRNAVERSRKDAKAPVLDVGRRIDACAAEFLDPVQAEEKRLALLAAEFVRAEQEKARRAALASSAAPEQDHYQAERATAQAAVAQTQTIMQPMKGVSESPDFEVVDVWAFAQAFPALCNPPTPRRAEILAKLEKTLERKKLEDIRIPGLRVFMATKVRGVRS
jgi:hypothetical protein